MTPPQKTSCRDTHCVDHSGRIEKEKNFEASLLRIENKIDTLLQLERLNEKRIDKVYIVGGTVWVMSSVAFGVLALGVKMGWL